MYSKTLHEITDSVWIPICKTGDFTVLDKWTIPAGTLVELLPQVDDTENMEEGGNLVFAEVADGPLVGMKFHCRDSYIFRNA